MPLYWMAHQGPDPTLFPLEHYYVSEILKSYNQNVLWPVPLHALEMTGLIVGGDVHEDEAGILQHPSLLNKELVQAEGMV